MRPEHKKTFESLTDWQLMGLCIEREAGGEPFEGRVAVGTVILERVDHRKWDGETIKEVVFMRWQFSWTMPEAGESYYNESVQIASNWVDEFRKRVSLQECCEIATRMINRTLPRDPELAAVNCCQYLRGDTRQSMDDQWEKETDKVKKEKINKKRWWKDMRLAKTIEHHEFYF